MKLIYEFDLDILKLYLHTKKEVSIDQGFQKLEHEPDRQTQTDAIERIISRIHEW